MGACSSFLVKKNRGLASSKAGYDCSVKCVGDIFLGLRLGRDGPLAPPVPERPGMPTARSVTAMPAAHAYLRFEVSRLLPAVSSKPDVAATRRALERKLLPHPAAAAIVGGHEAYIVFAGLPLERRLEHRGRLGRSRPGHIQPDQPPLLAFLIRSARPTLDKRAYANLPSHFHSVLCDK